MNIELKPYMDSIPAVGDAARLKEVFWMNDKMVPQNE